MLANNYQNSEPSCSDEETNEVELEEQFIIRFPEDIAKSIHEAITAGKVSNKLSLHLDLDFRSAIVFANNEILQGKLVRLPTIVDSYKTTDNVNFYKVANISEMLICNRETTQPSKEVRIAGVEHIDEENVLPHGLTPPTRNIRKRYRKHHKKKSKSNKLSEQETLHMVKRLIRADKAAINVDLHFSSDNGDSDEEESENDFQEVNTA
ncbi:transcription initiation factor TFIID subunit 7-like isoform X1 [Drosophila sulfurigaster albostrigata]|uniref:transcription initiation factor TFIID subunit 7-like isoform X1 n=1 Tax=Drosophila sulfurigaster albostrigata TaxID=89887 RepID=UPI002D21CDFC|nr:transcription initiation factor TFIID subunit 7-like isoform X1 [Drosophila sulfurigaster albostrigata]